LRETLIRRLPPQTRSEVERLESLDEVMAALARLHPSYGTVILRTRSAEDALASAVARGARQYVIVGAGMDSFALRRPPFAKDVAVFEVDHPASQQLKRQRLNECGVSPPDGVHYVAADLSAEGLDQALERSPFDPKEKAFFSWLGVTAYLPREANLKTLQAIASCGAPESELVFTYIDQSDFDAPADEERRRARDLVASLGEPWLSGFYPSQLADDLRSVGLTLIEDLGRDELQMRYCAGREDRLSASAVDHVVRARIAD
ncbi:MAG: SAM-dependent methyltransferase, partial [Actinomycetota bacterium]|nr:SAM-dependent methyltransferase [Actinomycetota bacterium]